MQSDHTLRLSPRIRGTVLASLTYDISRPVEVLSQLRHKIKPTLRPCFLLSLVLGGIWDVACAAPLNDAYRYEDTFTDNTGIDLNSSGFVNLGGLQTAKSKHNKLVSNCFELTGAAGSSFTGWSFAEVVIDNLTQVQSSSMHVESCDGSVIHATFNPPVGTTSIDLAAIPVSAPALRLRWDLSYQGNGGARTAAISAWKALGTTTGATGLQITPSATSINSNSDISFSLGLSSNSVITKNPILSVDLNTLNGTPNVGASGIGLATDATVCYDLNSDGTAGLPHSECKRYRPIEFLSASGGTSGEPVDLSNLSQPAQVPATAGPTDGQISWQLNDLPDGYASSISVNLHVPKGYIDNKSLALKAVLSFGESSADGLLNNNQSITSLSPTVTVTSAHAAVLRNWSPFGNIAPGSSNIYDNFFIRNQVAQNTNPSDLEHITVNIKADPTSSCVPVFRSATAALKYNWPYQMDSPSVGTSLDTHQVSVQFFRASYVNDSSNARTSVYYDVPAGCSNGTSVVTQGLAAATAPSINSLRKRTHNVVFEACRSGYNHMHRAQSGLLVSNDYQPSPAWPEYYINNGNVKPGEFISTWSPFGNSSYRWHTIVLDKTYALIDVPSATTFHGYRNTTREDADSKFYYFKDSTGLAPNPTDATFDNNFDPTTDLPGVGWHRIATQWTGPFSDYTGTAADDSNPNAVVAAGARILVVKTNDNTSSGASDYGQIRAQAVWRVCDGTYNCPTPPDDTQVRVTGNVYTFQQVQTPFVRHCDAITGHRTYSNAVSFPKVYANAEQQNVQAGGIASIILTPHNSNLASQYVDGRWAFDLSAIAGNIDIENVTGEVLIDGLNLPLPNQNISGQSCQSGDISFVAPTQATPIAYWNIPPQCQIPNGWGLRITNDTNQDNYTPAYQLKLNAPVLNTTLAGSTLEFPAQVRHNDLSTLGANNAVATNRWPASHYQASAVITVLENPSINAIKTAPAGWPVNSTFSYVLTIENQGNTPLFGYFLLDQLPRTGVNGSEFDPDYGAVYINAANTDAILETSTDSLCHSDPLAAAWVEQTLTASSRPGYQTQTQPLAATTLCVRLRRATAGPPLQVAASINMAIDINIPDDVFLSGKSLYNKALVAVSDILGGSSNIGATETSLVSTIVDGAVVLGATKSTTASLNGPGQVGWLLGYQNTSGTVAYTVTVSDTLADTLTYLGLMSALPAGVSCTHGSAGDINGDGIDDCALIGANPDGSGGTLELTIDELQPDDGNPTGGADQGETGIWTALSNDQAIENCVTSIPAGGVGGNACINGQLSQATTIKTQTVANQRAGTSPAVYFGESIEYTISITNNDVASRYIRLQDQLPAQLIFEPGSLIINGATASDGLFSGNQLDYLSPQALTPGEQLTVSFFAHIESGNNGDILANSAVFMLCADRIDESSCSGARLSNQVQARISGSSLHGIVFNDNGAGAVNAHDGKMSGNESGLSGHRVTLTQATGNFDLATATTNHAGEFELFTELTVGEQYTLTTQTDNSWLPVSHNTGNTSATATTPATTTLNFTHTAPWISYQNIRFGLVNKPGLHSNEVRTVIASQTILIPHTYTVTTRGMLNFNLTDATAVTTLNGWGVSLFHDTDCNQSLSVSEPQILSPVTVDPDTTSNLCLLFKLQMPGPLAGTLQLHVPLTASLTLSDAAATGHGVAHDAGIVDTITIPAGASGYLALEKLVNNNSRSGIPATTNIAIPGEILEYRINYEVQGGAPITDINIYDSTPAYSTLHSTVTCPAGIQNCVVILPVSFDNTAGYSGPVQWQINGSSPAGTNGSLRFEVIVRD